MAIALAREISIGIVILIIGVILYRKNLLKSQSRDSQFLWYSYTYVVLWLDSEYGILYYFYELSGEQKFKFAREKLQGSVKVNWTTIKRQQERAYWKAYREMIWKKKLKEKFLFSTIRVQSLIPLFKLTYEYLHVWEHRIMCLNVFFG